MTSSSGNAGLCLLGKVHPKSSSKETRVLELLGEAFPYYRTEKSKCTAWCYLTRSTRKKALGQPKDRADAPPLVLGVELYTHKDALTTQLQDKEYFQKYHEMVKKEDLYAKPEELVVWYPTRGFVSRGSAPTEHEDGMMVLIAEVACKDEKARNAALEVLGKLADWVTENEPDTLSFSAMTRPKDPKGIFIFERYRSTKAMLSHMGSKDVQKFLSQVGPHSSGMSITEWKEVDQSFVAPHPNIGNAGGSKM